MKTDYEQTKKIYKKLNSYVLKNDTNEPNRRNGFRYFGSSIQFKTCKNFKKYLEEKYPNESFIVHKAVD